MKVLSLLIAFWASHSWPGLSRWRRYDWLLALPRRLRGVGPDWLPFAAVATVALGAGWLATAAAIELAGLFGALILGVVAVSYTLGPHSLDRDLERASGTGAPEAIELARERMLLTADADGQRAAAAALHAALARWFGVVFWFAVLGPAGCLLYRGVREAHHSAGLGAGERSWLAHALGWLNWPVVALMMMAVALMTDLDRVCDVFKGREDRWLMPAALLDDLARALCDASGDQAEGLTDGRRLAWRTMTLWLAVLSLLLLAGLFS